MEQLIIGLLTVIAGSVLTTIGLYIGFIQRLRIKTAAMAVEIQQLKDDYNGLKLRVDGHSKKQDTILAAVHEVNNILSSPDDEVRKAEFAALQQWREKAKRMVDQAISAGV